MDEGIKVAVVWCVCMVCVCVVYAVITRRRKESTEKKGLSVRRWVICVCMWRLRGGSLRSCPLNLDQFHSLEFTDLALLHSHSADATEEHTHTHTHTHTH